MHVNKKKSRTNRGLKSATPNLLRRAGKSLLIGFVALALLFSFLPLGKIPITQAGVPYIQNVYYVSPTEMYMTFSESMATSTIGVADFAITTEIATDNSTTTSVSYHTGSNANDSVKITASGAAISPSWNDYIKVVGDVKSSATSGSLPDAEKNMTWSPVIPTHDLKISEVQIAGTASSTDEFIELYNRSGTDINMNEMSLRYATSTGTEIVLVADFGAATTSANGFYLIASDAYTTISPTPDATYDGSAIDIPANATIILRHNDANNNRVIDMVGFGTAPLREGQQATTPGTGSIERKATYNSTAATMAAGGSEVLAGNAYDVDDNACDFVVQTVPVAQNKSSDTESPSGQGSGDPNAPNIMHMGLWQAKIGQDLKVIARISDAETSFNNLTAELYYKYYDGSSWTAWQTAVSGVHIASGFFKFIIPSAAIANTTGFQYYLKASDGTNCRYMSGDPTADTNATGVCPGSEPTAVQDGGWLVSGNAGSTWTNFIQGHVYQSDCSTEIGDALVFAEGTGFSAMSSAVDGSFTLSGLYPGTYNLVAVAAGYDDQMMSGVEHNATWPQFCLYTGSGGGGGGDTDKPYVIWSAPNEGMMGAPVDISLTAAPITIGFNKALDSTTIDTNSVKLNYWDGSSEQAVTVAVSYSSTDYTITISSNTNLSFGKDYMAVITPAVKDTAGNSVQGNNPQGGHQVWFNTGFNTGASGTGTFSTGGGTMPPFVVGAIPRMNISDVAINSKIFVKFTTSLDSASVSATTIQLWKLDSSMAEVSQDTSAAVTLEPNEKEIAIITPSANMVSNTSYRIKVKGNVRSTTGMYLEMPENPGYPNTMFMSEFKTTSSTSADGTGPTVQGNSLDMYDDGAGNVTGVPVSLGSIEIFFSEALGPTTVNNTTIYLKAGTSDVSGTAEYDPMDKVARFFPSAALVPYTTYTLTYTAGIKDATFPGNALTAGTYAFTTGAADTTGPEVMFASADDFRIAITFSEPMNSTTPGQPQYTNSVLNKANYAIAYWGPNDTSWQAATAGEIANITVIYDAAENTAEIQGFDSYAHRGHKFKVTVTGVKDRSGNAITEDGTVNVGQGEIQDSAMTGGMMGPGGGGMMGPTGGGMDFMTFGMKPCGAWPMNMMAGMTSRYMVDLPLSVALANGDQVLLTFPAGFGVANAAAVAATESKINADLNQMGPGTVTISDVTSTGQTVIVTLAMTSTPLPADDFLHFELKTIKNGQSQGTDTMNSNGYSVTIKTKRPSTGAILENFSTMPFFLTPSGNLSLSGQVLSGSTGINAVTVFLGSPMTGPMEATSAANAAGGGKDGEYIFSSLPSGEYFLFTKPFMTVGGTDYLGDPMPKNIYINQNTTQNVTIKDPTTAAVTAVTIKLKGNFGTDAIDIMAGSGTMMGEGGFAVKPGISPGNCTDYGVGTNCTHTLYLPTQSTSTWHVGIGPAMPMGPTQMGPMPSVDWIPPVEQDVYVSGGVAAPSSLNIGITSADEKIIGYVYDGRADGTTDLGTSIDYGTPVKDVDVDAHRREGFGMPAHTRTDESGKFTLSVTTGTYFLNVWFPGMPPAPEKKVRIDDNGSLVDGNSYSDVYAEGIPVTTAAPLVFKLGKSGYTISGTVSDGTNPVAYAPVWAFSETTGFHIPGGTDSSGSFTLYVPAGTWKVQANIPGKGDVPPETVTIPTSESDGCKRNLSLQPLTNAATITGTVTVVGTAQGWAHVWITGTDTNGNKFENGTPTRGDGTYSLTAPAGTGYILRCFIPDYGEQAPINIGTLAASQSVTGKDFTIGSGTVATLTFVFNNSSNLSGKEAWVDVFNQTTGMGQGQHINDVNDVQTYEKLKVVAGNYNIRAHIPGFGEYLPTSPTPTAGIVALSAGATTVTFNLPTTTYTVSGLVYIDTNSNSIYDIGTDTLITEGFVWLENWENGYHAGSDIAGDGTYSVHVPGGTGRNFYLGADVPGYTAPAPTKISGLTGDLSGQNIAVIANDRSISGRIVNSSGDGVGYAWVWAEKVDSAHTSNPSLGTFSGHTHTEADQDGYYTLSASSGYWWLHAAGPGYQETWETTARDLVANTSITGANLTVNALVGYVAKPPKIKNVKPSEGGVVDDTANTGVKITVPATALGDSTDYAQVTVTEKSGGGTNAKATLGNTYYEIKATDSSGAAISGQLDEPLEVEIHYNESDLPTGFDESQLTFNSMGESGGWQEDMFTVDTQNNIIRVKLSHLSSVATTYPSDADRPTTPGKPSVSGGASSISLSWTASTDNVAVAGYEVYRSTSAGGTFTNISGDCEATGSFDSSVLVAATSYTDSTAVSGTTYYYKVSAYDTSGNASAAPSTVSSGVRLGGGAGGGGIVSGGAAVTTIPETSTGNVTATATRGGITRVINTDNSQIEVTMPAQAITSNADLVIGKVAKATVVEERPVPTGKSVVGSYVYSLAATYSAVGTAVASFAKNVSVEFTYTDAQITGLDEAGLTIYRWDGSSWQALTTTVDAANNTAAAETSQFSYFALMGSEAAAVEIVDGDVIRCPSCSDPFAIWIVKIVGETKYIRHMVTGKLFDLYGHLDWANVKEVDSLDDYTLSGWIRVCTNADGTAAPTDKVYEVNDDITKHWVNMTAEEFLAHGGSEQAIYNTNQAELDLYTPGPDVMYQ